MSMTFCELIGKYSIFIPKIQRDYVQYRKYNEVNLDKLIEKLVKSVVNDSEELNLNFIYGYNEKTKIAPNTVQEDTLNVFIPIDGQQRLTTLFLLHYYVFSKSDKGVETLKNKLIYDTRESTNDFIKLLLENKDRIFGGSDGKIDEKIKNYSWYCSEWDYDASIKSMLLVLRKIEEKFKNKTKEEFNQYAEKLLSNKCPIKFMIMEIDVKYGNELYIKMNARGKQLTPFENFKADLLGHLKSKGNEMANDIANGIANGLDGAWQNLFFTLWSEGFKDDIGGEMACIDLFFKKFFHYFITNYYLLNSGKTNDEKWNKIKDEKWNKIKNIDADNSFFDDYKDILDGEEKLEECIRNLRETFKHLCALKDKQNELFNEILSDIFSIKGDESEAIKNNRFDLSMPQRVYLYAFYCMGRDVTESKDFNFEDYWRITENLINNAEIDDVDSLMKSLRWFDGGLFENIEKFGKNHQNIIYSRNEWGNALRDSQIYEEYIKLDLIRDNGWGEVIREAEEMSYFRGEIYFLLCASRSGQDYDLETFKKVLTKIKKIFADRNGISDDNSILLHKLLLTLPAEVGKYPEKTSNRGENNYILNYYRNNEKHHDQDWRGLFRKCPDIIKQAFDDFEGELDFKKFAEGKIQNHKTSHCNDGILVRHFDLINSYYRVWFYNGEYKLLKGANRDRYLDCRFIAKMDDTAKKEKITFTFGSNSDRQMAEIGEKKIYYQGGIYYSSKGEELPEEEIGEYLKCPVNGT